MKKHILVPLSVVILLFSSSAYPRGAYLSDWGTIYPGSTSDSNGGCQLCHAASTQNLNPYGEALCLSAAGDITNRIVDVENLNSDADPTGSDNITETNASTQPGWTPGNVNPTYNRGNCSPTGIVEAPPSFIVNLDPALSNLPPVADANGPYSGTVNVALSFDGTASSDPDGTIVAYSWNFGDGNVGSGATPTHTYLTAGIFTVSLTVTDDIGDTGTATSMATIGLGNLPPVADPNGPYTGTVGIAVAFDGSASSDPDGSIISYSWDFGDGVTGTGANPTHIYASASVYNVTLTVMDDTGATDAVGTTANISAAPVNQPPVSDPNGPYTGTVGIAVAFDGSASSDPDGTITDYSWDFGDGASGTGVNPTHTYAIDGNYTVTLTVTDDEGATDLASTTASIDAVNLPPVSDPNGPYTGAVGIAVAFDGSASNDPDGTITTYSWDFGDGNIGTGQTPVHTYVTNGIYTVTLVVTDDVGDTGSATTSATIGLGNQPPVADANGPYTGTAGIAVAFDGSASSDPDGTIVAYSWDFGDGASGTGANPTHVYAAAGLYNVTLTVTDDVGATDAAGSTANISAAPVNQPPVADANGPYTGTAGIAVAFDGSASSDPDGTIVAYSWDFGDGASGTGANPTHAYAAAGLYSVILTVTDNAGASGAAGSTADISAAPGNQSPVADANGPYTGTAGIAVAFDGSASSDPDGTIVAYNWNFGDGASGTGANPTHAYAAAGIYSVTLTVTDNAGASGAAGSTANIIAAPVNQPPVADANGPYTGTAGIAVAFDGSASSDPDGTIVAYSWDFGDGASGTGANPTHTYVAAGLYNITLTVTDDAGATDAAGSTANISAAPVNQPPVADANGPYTGTAGIAVAFDGSASSDPDGTIVAYDWNFGDGASGTGITPTHTYAAAGMYNVTLTVTDDAAATDSISTTAVIKSTDDDDDDNECRRNGHHKGKHHKGLHGKGHYDDNDDGGCHDEDEDRYDDDDGDRHDDDDGDRHNDDDGDRHNDDDSAAASDASFVEGLIIETGSVNIQSTGQRLSHISSSATGNGAPTDVDFPFGVISYQTTVTSAGGSQNVHLTFSESLPDGLVLYKVDEEGVYTIIPESMWIKLDDNCIDLTFTDGGAFDLDGLENGVIVDPLAVGGKLAKPAAVSSSDGAGSTSPWMLLLLLLVPARRMKSIKGVRAL